MPSDLRLDETMLLLSWGDEGGIAMGDDISDSIQFMNITVPG